MIDSKPTPFAEWMHLHSMTIVKMAELIDVSRQTISRIARGDFEKIDATTIQKIVNYTGLTWESLCTAEPSLTHRRTGIPIIDNVIPNLIRDLHVKDTVSKYRKYISPKFKCTSPHYFQPAPARIGELWTVTEGDTINGEVLDYSKGYVDWETMCRYNLPDLDQSRRADQFTTVESIDIVCTNCCNTSGSCRGYNTSTEMLIVTKAIWHLPHQLFKMPLTLLRITLENPIVESTEKYPPRIKDWWWMELPSP